MAEHDEPHSSSDSIDRLAPARRPQGRVAMSQKWRDLLFLHWPVPVDSLRPLVPEELEIDLHDGVAYVGLVPFSMRDVHPRGLPAWRPMSDFHETNVRTYVHRRGRDPGVWFFSLDAANAAAVAIARTWFHLPYWTARMRVQHDNPQPGALSYYSERRWTSVTGHRPGCRIACLPTGSPAPAEPGTLDHFLVERYLLYAFDPHKHRLFRGQVHHSPYQVQPARILDCDENLLAAAGITHPSAQPISHFSTGVDVDVYGLERLT